MDPYGPTGTIKLSCIGFHLRDDHWGLNLRGLRMKFHKNVTMFDFAGIPIVANYDNGIIIGLTAAGAEICRKLLVEDLDRSEISLVDQSLFDQLSNSCFFEGPRYPPALKTVYFHVTSRCDLTCQGCYSYKEGRNSCEDPSLECIKKALDEISSRGISQLVISGGEPFLRDDLPDIVAYAKEVCGIPSLAILSNGLHIDQSSLHRLSGHSPCISISFDGYSAESQAHIRGTQNYSKLVDSIKQIKSAGIQGHIIATIHALNIEDVLQYVTLSKRLGVTINFSLISFTSSDPHTAGLIPSPSQLYSLGDALFHLGSDSMAGPHGQTRLNISAKRYCGAAKNTLSIDSDGTVYPCHMLHEEKYAMGNVFIDSLANALDSDVARLFQQLDASRFETCSTCKYCEICGGGCRARSLCSSPTLAAPDPYCPLMIRFFELLEDETSRAFCAVE